MESHLKSSPESKVTYYHTIPRYSHLEGPGLLFKGRLYSTQLANAIATVQVHPEHFFPCWVLVNNFDCLVG